MIALAVTSGIPVREWLAEDDRTIVTALQLLGKNNDDGDDEDWPMSGGGDG